MLYSGELKLLCSVMKKSHIQFCFASPNNTISSIIDKDLVSVLGASHLLDMHICNFIGDIEQNTVYKISDDFNICYLYFILPEIGEETLIFIGPYIKNRLSQRQILELCEKKQIPPQNQKNLYEYYSNIPLVSETSHLFVMLECFYEQIWGCNNFSVIDTELEQKNTFSPIERDAHNSLEDTLVNINLMEKRYSYENELIQAVTMGQAHKADLLLSGLTSVSFEKRVADPLRNMKNYCIIMNTLLRKAAENGGVRPIYLDKVSSSFAIQIEQISEISEITTLMREIFRSYCRLVQKHSVKNFSPLIQKAVIFIESDLSANLTLSSLSNTLNVSKGYLSTIFKKETGKTVTEYIRDKRLKYATYLLRSTNLQIQTVAMFCGIMDVQYFSKTFKKQIGKTPMEYRIEAHKNTFK